MNHAGEELRAYVTALQAAGFVAADGGRKASAHANAQAAGTMLLAALFADAMGREMMPGIYPEPADRAPAIYVKLFLRAVGCEPLVRRRTRPTSRPPRS
jgi:hypothetical protein